MARGHTAVLREEAGMTIVEIVVAATLLVTVAISTFGLIDTSTRSTFRAEETQSVINIAQREMEALRDYDYDELAMESVPPAGTGQTDPTSRIRDVNGTQEFCLDRSPTTTASCPDSSSAPLVVDDGSVEGIQAVTPDVAVGDITVDIYRFVVWQDQGAGLPLPSDVDCAEKPQHYRCMENDYKRAVVAVHVDKGPISHDRPYEEVQSDFVDPDRSTLDAAPLGPQDEVIGQQFYLSDTRCGIDAGDPTRPPASNHETHDTLGNCAAEATDAPDALLGSPPVDPDPLNENDPPFFDYSTEPPLEPGGCTTINCSPDDIGLQMLEQPSDCVPAPIGPDASRQIHRWVSRPMPSGGFEIAEEATLELWTRTINDVPNASGRICAFLFRRVAGADTILAIGSHADSTWPAGPAWSEVRVRFDLTLMPPLQRTLAPGDRLGVSVGVDPSGTPDNVLQFLYDHPEGESRLEVLTTTPLQ
jgi:type II secretory pathway pseudopilin PulG